MVENERIPAWSRQWMMQRRLGYERIEALRLEELSRMTEADSARIFSQLEPLRPFPVRSTSGLVEQQRLFTMLRSQATRTRQK